MDWPYTLLYHFCYCLDFDPVAENDFGGNDDDDDDDGDGDGDADDDDDDDDGLSIQPP